jgi:hypothetical protein
LAHRSCLDLEAAFDRRSSDVTAGLANGVRTLDARAVANCPDGTGNGSREAPNADSFKSCGRTAPNHADAHLGVHSDPEKRGASWRQRL